MRRLRHNDEKHKEKSSKNEELTENECEQECFNLLIDEHVCNNLHDVCLLDLTHEEKTKFYRRKKKKNQNSRKKKIMQKKV